METIDPAKPVLCSECFRDRGLSLEALKLGALSLETCPNCGSTNGAKLTGQVVQELAHNFFVLGTYVKTEYGGATVLRSGPGNVHFASWLQPDMALLNKFGISYRYNAPRTWLLGEIEQLESLREPSTQTAAADDVVKRFPRRVLAEGETFYRLRIGVPLGKESEPSQYDAPPHTSTSIGRLNQPGFPVLYGSQDLEICVHECRVTKADNCYLATLKPKRALCLLDLCRHLDDDGSTPFQSLYIAVRLIFSAEEHSYHIGHAIARAAQSTGLDGIAYPSYFSSLKRDQIPNLALFGYPVKRGDVELYCANRLSLETAAYTMRLGPCLLG
jgi:RES domain